MSVTPKLVTIEGRRARLLALALAAGAAVGVLASACGGSSSEGVAHADTTNTNAGPAAQARSGDPAAYAACMRTNGVGKFPDPDPHGGIQLEGVWFDQNSAVYQAAVRACKRLLPAGPSPSAQQLASGRDTLEKALRYSACLREHGLSSFPDPVRSAQGGLDRERTQARIDRVNTDSPRYRAAAAACKDLGVAAKQAAAGPDQGPR